MKNRKLILILFFALFLIIVTTITKFPNVLRKKLPKYTGDINQTFEVKGVFSGLFIDQSFKDELSLTNGKYELTMINNEDSKKLPYSPKFLYIENYPSNPNKYLGKCVLIKGKIDNDWLAKTTDLRENEYPYINRHLAFNAESIEKKDFNECEGYSDLSNSPEIKENSPKVYSGTVDRGLRDLPDEGGQDYVLIVEKPTGESTTSVTRYPIPLVPANNNIWTALEKNVKEKIAVEGVDSQGYGKNYYFVVTRILE